MHLNEIWLRSSQCSSVEDRCVYQTCIKPKIIKPCTLRLTGNALCNINCNSCMQILLNNQTALFDIHQYLSDSSPMQNPELSKAQQPLSTESRFSVAAKPWAPLADGGEPAAGAERFVQLRSARLLPCRSAKISARWVIKFNTERRIRLDFDGIETITFATQPPQVAGKINLESFECTVQDDR